VVARDDHQPRRVTNRFNASSAAVDSGVVSFRITTERFSKLAGVTRRGDMVSVLKGGAEPIPVPSQ
jgi:hypothetical protein